MVDVGIENLDAVWLYFEVIVVSLCEDNLSRIAWTSKASNAVAMGLQNVMMQVEK
jgi:hypothetical protein